MFNFDNIDLIYKIYPSVMNKGYQYDKADNEKIRRLNSIIQWNYNYLLITERNTGYIFIVEVNVDDNIKLEVKNCFNIYTTEVISIRKFLHNQFLILGIDELDEETMLVKKERIKIHKIN